MPTNSTDSSARRCDYSTAQAQTGPDRLSTVLFVAKGSLPKTERSETALQCVLRTGAAADAVL